MERGFWLGRDGAGMFLALGFWNSLAPFAGHALDLAVNTRTTVEVVDHVIPGVVVVLVAAGGLRLKRIPLWALLLAVLAGFWATATHLPLLLQVPDQVGLATALWHSTPGVFLFLFAGILAVAAWNEEGP